MPYLSTYPYIKVWHAGCSTGQEVLSHTILLHENNILEKAIIYATDFKETSIQQAENGIFPLSELEDSQNRYIQSGGKQKLTNYYHTLYNHGKIIDPIKQYITYTYHNLAQDGIFGEMNVIFCRNVLIYFDKKLQNKVFSLLLDSLRLGGYLCLGKSETISFSDIKDKLQPVDKSNKIYKKIRR